MTTEWICRTCDANWTAGAFTADCSECGGGAMERGCTLCGGACGAVLKRAPMDSNDFRESHWIGGCALPEDEQTRLKREWLERERDRAD